MGGGHWGRCPGEEFSGGDVPVRIPRTICNICQTYHEHNENAFKNDTFTLISAFALANCDFEYNSLCDFSQARWETLHWRHGSKYRSPVSELDAHTGEYFIYMSAETGRPADIAAYLY